MHTNGSMRLSSQGIIIRIESSGQVQDEDGPFSSGKGFSLVMNSDCCQSQIAVSMCGKDEGNDFNITGSLSSIALTDQLCGVGRNHSRTSDGVVQH